MTELHLSDFDYDLPPERIAQTPIEPRDAARLLVMPREGGNITHRHFYDVGNYLKPGDVLVFNQTRVIPARIQAHKRETGGAVELLLLREIDSLHWLALAGGKRVTPGTQLTIPGAPSLEAEVVGEQAGAQRVVRFSQPLRPLLDNIGEIPLPPYIHEPLADTERYQTIYARTEGSAAAPTAGLHFTGDLLLSLKAQGIKFAYCTLHIGLDTFQPVKVENLADHHMHSEWASLSARDAQVINEAKLAGGRIIAVGTTVVRTLESAAILSAGGDPSAEADAYNLDLCPWRPVTVFEGQTRLFIRPGFHFRAIDGLITNFHLPRSTLLMLVSAFLGREHTLQAYEMAKAEGYRFYSFGDAMLVL